MVGMGVVVLYFTTVRSQGKFDVLYEQDLRAYYLGESGFQYTVGKLHESRRYEERWYQPSLNVSLSKEFRYTGQQAYGVFQSYLTQVDEQEKFSHLFLLSKGIYFSGKTRRDGVKERVIAIIKGNLAYSPKPPSEEEQKFFIVDKSPLNQSELLRFITDPKFKKLFTVDKGVIPSKIRSLLEFLKTNKLEDIDFASEPALMKGIAQLDRLNQKIKYLKRVSSYTTKQTSILDEQTYFPEQVPLDKPIPFLSQQDLKPNLDITRKKNKEKDEKSAAVCLIVTVLFSGALRNYCEKNEIEESFEQTIKAYDKHIKESLKNCKKDINVHNCKEVLEVIKDKYL